MEKEVEMPALYHFSEDPSIDVFVPHRARTSSLPDQLVWAIDDWHAPMYYVPRDCPRACFWPGPQTTAADRGRWFEYVQARMVIAIETGWLDRLRSTSLYRYTVPEDTFQPMDATAGHWVSRETVRPVSVEPVGDLLTALSGADVELRLTPSLIPLWSEVIRSTLAFSGARLRNAQGYDALSVPDPATSRRTESCDDARVVLCLADPQPGLAVGTLLPAEDADPAPVGAAILPGVGAGD